MIAMTAIQKRCFIGSITLHGFLFLLVAFGAALFVSRQPPLDYLTLKVVPTRFIDGLSGGGGNPNLPVTAEQKKGSPTAPPQAIQPKPPTPAPQPAVSKPEVKRAEPKADPVKPAPSSIPKDPLNLKKVTRKTSSKSDTTTTPDKSTAKAKADSDARQAREARENADKLAKQIGKTLDNLGPGFLQGTAINVGGPGGEAYADYAQFVKQIYDDAWAVPQDLTAEDGVTLVKVTVMRDGRVARAVIVEGSRVRSVDQSVQRALDKVTKLPAFPEGTKDTERTFTIKFSLKARRGMA
jgi:TonB family protein